ncbi:MAG: hypothetical protein Q9223_003242 [Gallowayella weberi]
MVGPGLQALEGDANLKGRSTSWDNTPIEDNMSLKGRGSAWDSIIGPREGRNPDLGPKVGQGGKPQPLNGNDWEPGRRAESSTSEASILIRKRAMERANTSNGGKGYSGKLMPMGGCINCLRSRVKRWVASPFPTSVYPSGSRKGQPGGKSAPTLDEPQAKRF